MNDQYGDELQTENVGPSFSSSEVVLQKVLKTLRFALSKIR